MDLSVKQLDVSGLVLLGGPAGHRERLLAKISDHYVNRRTQNFLRAISPYNLPDRPVETIKDRPSSMYNVHTDRKVGHKSIGCSKRHGKL